MSRLRHAYRNPHEEILRLLKSSDSFWLEDIRFTGGVIKSATVTQVGIGWIQIQEKESDAATWINTDHIACLNIVEG